MTPIKLTHRSLGLVMAMILLTLPAITTANDKGEMLRRTMADIALLNSQMAQRKADAAGIRDTLTRRLKEIKSEIGQQLREKRIETHDEALDNPRIFYDLKLMAEIQAYSDRYTQRIAYYRVACDRLSYLYQQADDDLKIVNTLSDLKIDALISQTAKILDAYLPDAQTLVIQPDTLVMDPPQKIWQTLKAGG